MMSQLALVFPGQGSQEVGMLRELATAYPVVQSTFAEASETLRVDLWALVQDGPEAELNRTTNTQPALLAASVAIWRVWQALGAPQPSVLGGHSLGEYSALVCAGSISFADGIKLVRRRGELMQSAVAEGEGAMAAILGLEDAAVEQCCKDAAVAGVVSAANFNSPGQVVISGASHAVDKAIELCRTAGAKRAMRLAVSVPSHCSLMEQAAGQLEDNLRRVDIRVPVIPVVHNLDAQTAGDADAIRRRLVAQLFRPVQWTRCVHAMTERGVTRMVECGPGKVLSGLVRRIDRAVLMETTDTPGSLAAAINMANGEA